MTMFLLYKNLKNRSFSENAMFQTRTKTKEAYGLWYVAADSKSSRTEACVIE